MASKYVSVLVVWAGFLLLNCLAAAVYRLVGLTATNALPPATAFFGSLHMLILMGLFLYLTLRWDYLRAANGIRYIFLVFFLPVLVPRAYQEPILERLQWLASSPVMPILGPALVFAVYFGFMVLAERAFEKKELQDVA